MIRFRNTEILAGALLLVACAGPGRKVAGIDALCRPNSDGATLVKAQAQGIVLRVPQGAKGPLYDSDDYFFSRPSWAGRNFHIHFVYGNGGLTEFMAGDRCCTLNDEGMRRKICVGEYIGYGAVADISRIDSPEKVTSMQVRIEPGGLTEAQALSVIESAITTWEVE